MRTSPMESEKIIRRYLLGQLSDSDKETLEHEYLVKPAMLRKVEMGEDELIDEYLEKRLSEDDRRSFLQVFLTTREREEKLHLARALAERVSKRTGLRARMSRKLNVPGMLFSLVGVGAIAVLLALIAGLAWRLNQETRQVSSLQAEKRTWAEQEGELRARLARTDAEKARLGGRLTHGEGEKNDLQAEVRRLENLVSTLRVSTLRGPGRAVSLLLRRGVTPSGEAKARMSLPASAPLLELQLELAGEASGYQNYQAQLIRVEGASQTVQNSLLRRRNGEPRLIRFPVPSDFLRSGDYLIRLGGFNDSGALEDLDEYSFRLTR